MIYNKGGLHKSRVAARTLNHRKRYTINEKIQFVTAVEGMVGAGLSQNYAASVLKIDPTNIVRWRGIPLEKWTASSGEKLCLLHGPSTPAFLDDIEPDLLGFIEEWRLTGLPVSRLVVIRKAAQLKPSFLAKSSGARAMCVSRFLAKHGFVHRLGTHTAQRSPQEVQDEAEKWIAYAKPKCAEPNRHPDFILNMDQSNCFFANAPTATINARGARTVNIRTSKDDSKRCTAAFCITASGKTIKTMVVYKGTTTGTIARRELPLHPPKLHYCTQPKAWFDEATMLEWVTKVLAPYVTTAPAGIVPILFLDSFKVHLMGTVTAAIEALGVEVDYITAGCTGLVQPVDVGFNKPFKANMRNLYSDWLMQQNADEPIPAILRMDLSRWIIEALNNITVTTVKNSWRKTGYSYF